MERRRRPVRTGARSRASAAARSAEAPSQASLRRRTSWTAGWGCQRVRPQRRHFFVLAPAGGPCVVVVIGGGSVRPEGSGRPSSFSFSLPQGVPAWSSSSGAGASAPRVRAGLRLFRSRSRRGCLRSRRHREAGVSAVGALGLIDGDEAAEREAPVGDFGAAGGRDDLLDGEGAGIDGGALRLPDGATVN